MKTAYIKKMILIFGGALLLCAMKAHAGRAGIFQAEVVAEKVAVAQKTNLSYVD